MISVGEIFVENKIEHGPWMALLLRRCAEERARSASAFEGCNLWIYKSWVCRNIALREFFGLRCGRLWDRGRSPKDPWFTSRSSPYLTPSNLWTISIGNPPRNQGETRGSLESAPLSSFFLSLFLSMPFNLFTFLRIPSDSHNSSVVITAIGKVNCTK